MSRVASLKDLVKLLLLTDVFIYVLSPPRFYASEHFVALFTIINASISANSGNPPAIGTLNPLLIVPPHLLKLQQSQASNDSWQPLPLDINTFRTVKDLTNKEDKSVDDAELDNMRLTVISTAVRLLSDCLDIYKGEQSCVEIFNMAANILTSLKSLDILPPTLLVRLVFVKAIGQLI